MQFKDSELFRKIDKDLVKRFIAFHSGNKWVYAEFEKSAVMMMSTGKEKYSAWAIVNNIRWEKDLIINGKEVFKINNNFISLYARLLIYRNPSFENFFHLREMKQGDKK